MNTRNRRLAAAVLLLVAMAAAFAVGRLTGSPPSHNDPEERTIAYWRAPMDPTEIYDAPGTSRMGMDLVPVYEDELDDGPGEGRTVAYWRAPMDPTEIYDAPGTSRMGMDLVPVYEDELEDEPEGMVTIDPRTVQNMGVRSAEVERRDFSRMIRTVGEVQYDEENQYQVNAKISGWIETLHVNYVGEEVRRGAPLMEIYSPELVATQQEYLLAVQHARRMARAGSSEAAADADRLLASARKRLAYWDIPESEIARLEETGEVRKTLLLTAPASGVVVKKDVIEGAHIDAGMDLFQIADLRTVWVHASFYENEVPWIREGQPVQMELSYLPGKSYQGRVSYIYPYLREKARDVHVRLVFSNPDLALKPGMYANVELQGTVIPDAIVVPSEAVIRSGERSLVFVVRGEGRFEPREVRIGEEGGPNNAYVRVLAGLDAGERVVVSAQFLLDSESRLQEAIQKMREERRALSDDTALPEAMDTLHDHAMPDDLPDDSLEEAGAPAEDAHHHH